MGEDKGKATIDPAQVTSPRRMREAELFPPVKAWLEAQGYIVYAEIPCFGTAVDVVGKRGTYLVGVELKTALTEGLIRQACSAQVAVDESYVAVPTKPTKPSLAKCRRYGLGVLSVCDGVVKELLEPHNKFKTRCTHERMLQNCAGEPAGNVGGLPCLRGQGPAIDCRKRVREYLKEHPSASWQEMFRVVPNHYCSAASMRGGVGLLGIRGE